MGHIAAYVASGLSIMSLTACVLFLPYLHNKVNSINNLMKVEMDEFNVLSEETWNEIKIEISAQPKVRQSRQVRGVCQCGNQNVCPPGPSGPSGVPGDNGVNGDRGTSGPPGLPGIAPAVPLFPRLEGCRQCPPGRPGPSGRPGSPGNPGGRGDSGNPGNAGNPGRPGSPGQPGNNGRPGSPGKSGNPGPPGRDGSAGGKGSPGPRGPPGPGGNKGSPGGPGNAGQPGRPGNGGPPGQPGQPGNPGQPGRPGPPGPRGPPGSDAQYCPCPGRSIVPPPATFRPPPVTRPPPPDTTTTAAEVQIKVELCASIVPERFEDYSIVTDSLPKPPPCLVEVVYMPPTGRKDIYLGNRALETEMVDMPIKCLWGAEDSKYYTLVMYDLDSPVRNNPTNREVLLWMVINVPGYIVKKGTVPGISANSGTTIVDYIGPRPASGSGKHRIVWLAYLQSGMLSETIYTRISRLEIQERFEFHVHQGFIIKNRASWEVLTPVAGNFVIVSWESGQPGSGF